LVVKNGSSAWASAASEKPGPVSRTVISIQVSSIRRADRVACVQDEVQERVLEHAGVDVDEAVEPLAIEDERHAVGHGGAGDCQDVTEEGGEVDGHGPEVALARDRGEAVEEVAAAPGGGAGGGDHLAGLRAEVHRGQPALHAEDDREQVREVMRETRGELCREFAAACLGQRRARLRLFGHVGREDVDAARAVRREGDPDAAARHLVGELDDVRLARVGAAERGLDPRVAGAEDIGDPAAEDIGGRSGHDARQAAVGEDVAPARVEMCDMRGHHLGREPGAAFHLGEFALGFLERRDGRGQFAVGAGQFLGICEDLLRKLF